MRYTQTKLIRQYRLKDQGFNFKPMVNKLIQAIGQNKQYSVLLYILCNISEVNT